MNPPRGQRKRRSGGFLLLEIVLAVAIFTVGVLSLGECVKNCLIAQQIKGQEERARAALENRMAEIESSPALPDEFHQSRLKGMYEGVTLIERRRGAEVKNEKNVGLTDLYGITLTAQWKAPDGRTMTRELAFDLLRGKG